MSEKRNYILINYEKRNRKEKVKTNFWLVAGVITFILVYFWSIVSTEHFFDAMRPFEYIPYEFIIGFYSLAIIIWIRIEAIDG